MKISKLLQFILGMSGFFRMSAGEEGGGGALDMHDAAAAFSSLDGDDGHDEKAKPAGESPDDAAARLAAEDAASEPAAGDAPDAAEAITVEIDGKLVTLTKEQIAENHKNGLRQADYTQKTMAAAEARKAADAETAKARTDRATYAQQLNNYAITTDGAIREQEALLTDQLLQDSPLEYLAIERTVKQRQAQLVEAKGELQKLQHEHKQEQEALQRDYQAEQHQQLLDKLPEWKDPAKAKADAEAIRAHRVQMGYAPDMNNLTNHLDVITARKAMQYDALIERAKKTATKVAALPVKPERSGHAETSKVDGRTSVMRHLAQTNSIDAAAAAFSALG
jgi:DNA repair exonuclease SbcCD ATPase subunit